MFLYYMCTIMTKPTNKETVEPQKEVLIFRRFCPILGYVVEVEWELREWEIKVNELIDELEAKEAEVSQQ